MTGTFAVMRAIGQGPDREPGCFLRGLQSCFRGRLLLWRRRQQSTFALVRQSSRADLAQGGCRGEIVKARSDGPASTSSSDSTRCPQSGLFTATPPRANLSREEPDAGNPHVRVCEGWGWQRPHLLGDPASHQRLVHVPANPHAFLRLRELEEQLPYVLPEVLFSELLGRHSRRLTDEQRRRAVRVP